MRVAKKRKNSDKSILYLFPIIFIIAVVPLITYGKVLRLPPDEADFWKGGTTHFDFSSYYKSIYLVLSTTAAFASFLVLRLNNRISLQKEKRYYVPIAVYSVLAILSTVLSQNKHVALVGFIELHQGIFVLLSYIALAFLLINYTYDEKNIRVFVYSFIVLMITEGLLGVSEYFGYNFFQSPVGSWLITPKYLQGISLNFTSGKYTIFGTMYNSNFVGSFAAMMLPLSVTLYLSASDKKGSFFYGISSFLAFSLWLGCNSRAGYLGVISATVIGAVVFRKLIKVRYKRFIFVLTGYIIIAIIFNTVSGGRISGQFSRLNPVAEAENIEDVQIQQDVRFEKVMVKDNTFMIRTNRETLIGIAEGYKLTFTDESGNKLDTDTDEEGNIIFAEEKYSGYTFFIPSENPAQICSSIYGRDWDLYITDQGIKVISYNDKLTEPVEASRLALFDGRETFASNRGYIWSRTIPMLKDTFLVGAGPDNYILKFPHEDYVGRFNVGSDGMNYIVDKPHNLYLQTAVNTGVLSLVALAFIWGTYFIDSSKVYFKGDMNSFIEYIGAAIFLSITSYLAAGMFNDSIVAVAPLFWILLGMGIGINRMIKDNKKRSI